jgi:hypothetical protein
VEWKDAEMSQRRKSFRAIAQEHTASGRATNDISLYGIALKNESKMS